MTPRVLLLALILALSCLAGPAADLGAEVRQLTLDPDACFRVRDLTFNRAELRFYLTDGYLIFAKPIRGRRLVAIFHGPENTDDAEILLRPPVRAERASLAKFTGAPNLNEHFRTAVFIYTDNTFEELQAQFKDNPGTKPSAEMGLLLASRYQDMARNLANNFLVRVVNDLLSLPPELGMFYTAITGNRLGNFDALFDPSTVENITLGQLANRRQVPVFDIWASFESRLFRRRGELPDLTPQSFRIDAQIDSDLLLTSTAHAFVRAANPVRGAITFEIAPELEVTAAKLDGQPVEVFRREAMRANLISGRYNQPVLVALPAPLEPGRTYDFEFTYSGRVIQPAGNKVYYVAARTNWYPTRGIGYSTFDTTFRIPAELSCVVTGDIVEEKTEGEWRIVHRKTSVPVHFAGFNIGAYEKVTVKRAGITVEVHGNRTAEPALTNRPQQVMILPPSWQIRAGIRRPVEVVTVQTSAMPDSLGRLTALADDVSSSMEWMQGYFGPPPLPLLTVSPIPGYFGQGFPGLIYLSTMSFLREQDRPRVARGASMQTFFSEILSAHEAAHQWWGNLVASASYHDDWIHEALANYTALMILERKKGDKPLYDTLDEYLTALRMPTQDNPSVDATGPITWGVRLHSEFAPDPWRVIIYNKGSWIMHMLRRRMGDAQFLAMLGDLRKKYEYKTLDTETFRAFAASYQPKDIPDPRLENFFDNWVYSTGIPTIDVTTSVKGKAPAVQLTVTVRQSGVSDDFGVDLPLEIRTSPKAKPIVKWIRTSSDPAIVTLNLKAPPTKVELAPGAGVLAAMKK